MAVNFLLVVVVLFAVPGAELSTVPGNQYATYQIKILSNIKQSYKITSFCFFRFDRKIEFINIEKAVHLMALYMFLRLFVYNSIQPFLF